MSLHRIGFSRGQTNCIMIIGAALALGVAGMAVLWYLSQADPVPLPEDASSEMAANATHYDVKPKIDAFIVPENAESVSYDEGVEQSYHVSYIIAEPYPAKETLGYVASQLKAQGWQPVDRHWLNSDSSSSHVTGWTKFIDASREPKQVVRRWIGQWEDPNGNIVTYEFRYWELHPETLSVTAGWFSAATAEMRRELR